METNTYPGLNKEHGFLTQINSLVRDRSIQDGIPVMSVRSFPASSALRTLPSTQPVRVQDPPVMKLAQPSRVQDPPALKLDQWTPRTDYKFSGDESNVSIERMIETVHLAEYAPKAQLLICKAIQDPHSLRAEDQAKVADMLVERASKDPGYAERAAIVCSHLAEMEKKANEFMTIPMNTFRNGLVESCRVMMSNAEAIRAENGRHWLSFVSFVSEIYKRLRGVERDPIMSLGRILFDALFALAQPPCSNNIEEVSALVIAFQMCGRDLIISDADRMTELVGVLRMTFLSDSTNPETRKMLLLLIELYAGDWKLAPVAERFHFDVY